MTLESCMSLGGRIWSVRRVIAIWGTDEIFSQWDSSGMNELVFVEVVTLPSSLCGGLVGEEGGVGRGEAGWTSNFLIESRNVD